MTTELGACFDTSEEEPVVIFEELVATSAELISSAGANGAEELALGLGEEGAEEKGDFTAPPHYSRGWSAADGEWRDSLHSLLVS